MANTRSMTRKQNRFSTSDNDNSASWSNLNSDLLLLIMMQVGVFDFIAFSGVCKSWRSVALSNWNKFMVSRHPMCLSVYDCLNKKDCYLEDYKERKSKITIPHSEGRICVGITCGYLIFYGEKTRDFWLVNPFTRKQLHFPGFPFAENTYPIGVRGILVFSPSMSGFVLVISHKFSGDIYFSLAGKQARWRNVTTHSPIHDLHFFKGKIYMINTYSQLLELRLNPEPKLTRLKMPNFPGQHTMNMGFVSSGENLYVRDIMGDVCKPIEIDFDEMKWVSSERTIRDYAVFVTDFFKSDAAIKPDTWAHAYPCNQYERLNYLQNNEHGRYLSIKMWYFPHDCLNVKDPDMKNGNILKD